MEVDKKYKEAKYELIRTIFFNKECVSLKDSEELLEKLLQAKLPDDCRLTIVENVENPCHGCKPSDCSMCNIVPINRNKIILKEIKDN